MNNLNNTTQPSFTLADYDAAFDEYVNMQANARASADEAAAKQELLDKEYLDYMEEEFGIQAHQTKELDWERELIELNDKEYRKVCGYPINVPYGDMAPDERAAYRLAYPDLFTQV